MNTDLNDFIHLELYPALYNNIPFAFPDMDFKAARDGWHSPHKMDGSEPRMARPDKCVITKKKPYLIYEQGYGAKDLITYQMERSNQSIIDAVKALADICGLQVPKGDVDSEIWKERREKAARMENQAKRMSEDLFTLPDAKPTLDYLRNVRGYSDDKIKGMGFGYCSKDMAKEIEGAPSDANVNFPLSIACRDARGVYEFKFRSASETDYKGYRHTVGADVGDTLFGLIPSRPVKEKDKDLIIVEGEIDTLAAQYEGFDNVVGAIGGHIRQKALQDAKGLGYKRVIVLFDTEGTEAKKKDNSPERIRKSQKDTDKKIADAVEVIAEAGMRPLVAILPSEHGEKEDADSYLRNHTREDFKKVIDGAVGGARYLAGKICQKAIERQGGNDAETTTDIIIEDYKDEILGLLLNEKLVSPTDEDFILHDFIISTNGIYTKEALIKEKEVKKAMVDSERRISDTIDASQKALDLAKRGKTEESIELMGQAYNELRKSGKEDRFRKMLTTPTQEAIYEGFRTAPSGIPTNYVFSEGESKERLSLPEGALTFVCAPSSHGKSTMLRNLALQVLDTIKQSRDGETILYYTLEEDFNSTLKLFVNTAFAKTITANGRRFNNLTTISAYYKSGRKDTKYIRGDASDFPTYEEEWIRNNIVSGKLRIISEADFDSKDLIDHIEYTSTQLNVKAVFIDYIQLLFTDGNRKTRNEELRDICREMRRLAVRTSLPIVAGAQLNREAKSPTEMKLTTIADSIDIAREANIALYLWNTAFEPDNGSTYGADAPKKIESVKRDQFTLGKRGNMYAVLRKNRGGMVNIDAVLSYDGNTGVIESNYKEEDFKDNTPGEQSGIQFN